MSQRQAAADARRRGRAPSRAGIGTAGARDPLAVEVRLLGALLGQVITEQAGPELFELVERIRRRTIALRRDDDPLERARLDDELAGARPRRGRGGHRRLRALLPARQPRRGAAAGSGRCAAASGAARDGVLDDSVADAVAAPPPAGSDGRRARRR